MGMQLGQKENRWRVFENRVLRRLVFKKDEITEGRRKLDEELHNLHSLLNIIRMIT
jgi:hypothetical protein